LRNANLDDDDDDDARKAENSQALADTDVKRVKVMKKAKLLLIKYTRI